MEIEELLYESRIVWDPSPDTPAENESEDEDAYGTSVY